MKHEYYGISSKDLGVNAKIPVEKYKSSEEIFRKMATEMFETIQKNNQVQTRTVFICPVGPVGQYPIFVDLVNSNRLDLKNVWFFNMDEYLNANGEWISESDLLSFRGFMNREVYSKIEKKLLMPPEQRVFPKPGYTKEFDELLEELGGADICFGGIGINGHVAFNEPDETMSNEMFMNQNTRVLKIHTNTLVTNAIAQLGGAIEDMPRFCITVGMKQILSAKKIRLGVFRDWHKAVCRRAAYGEMSATFPVSLLQQHRDIKIYANSVSAQPPYVITK